MTNGYYSPPLKADRENPRTKLEFVYIVGFTILTLVLAAALTLGVPALLLIRPVNEGAILPGLMWGAAGVVWITALVYAMVRDRATRGWLVLALIGGRRTCGRFYATSSPPRAARARA